MFDYTPVGVVVLLVGGLQAVASPVANAGYSQNLKVAISQTCSSWFARADVRHPFRYQCWLAGLWPSRRFGLGIKCRRCHSDGQTELAPDPGTLLMPMIDYWWKVA
jgi:hypothetical protein